MSTFPKNTQRCILSKATIRDDHFIKNATIIQQWKTRRVPLPLRCCRDGHGSGRPAGRVGSGQNFRQIWQVGSGRIIRYVVVSTSV